MSDSAWLERSQRPASYSEGEKLDHSRRQFSMVELMCDFCVHLCDGRISTVDSASIWGRAGVLLTQLVGLDVGGFLQRCAHAGASEEVCLGVNGEG